MTHEHNQPFARRILERIDEEHVVPRPRWEFIAKNYFFWLIGAAAVLLGALAFAAALFVLENADWTYAEATHSDALSFALAVAPYLWVAALVLFVALGYFNIRSTKRGYRYPIGAIAIGAVLGSVALGSTLYAAGLGGNIEEAIGDHPPFYRPILTVQKDWWSAPDKGLLGGEVIQVATGTAHFIVKDFSGKEWQVDGSELDVPGAQLQKGQTVRIVGIAATSSVLHACFVFPWKAEKGKKAGGASSTLSRGASQRAEISDGDKRTEECKGIRPYAQLRRLEKGF